MFNSYIQEKYRKAFNVLFPELNIVVNEDYPRLTIDIESKNKKFKFRQYANAMSVSDGSCNIISLIDTVRSRFRELITTDLPIVADFTENLTVEPVQTVTYSSITGLFRVPYVSYFRTDVNELLDRIRKFTKYTKYITDECTGIEYFETALVLNSKVYMVFSGSSTLLVYSVDDKGFLPTNSSKYSSVLVKYKISNI